MYKRQPEQTEDLEDGQSTVPGLDKSMAGEEDVAVAAPRPSVNGTWKRVHACDFERVVKSQLASNICDDAKVN